MDFGKAIIGFLGLQDVVIEDLKVFRKQRRIELKVQQDRKECYCSKCGLQFSKIKEWELKKLKGPPLGIFQIVDIRFIQLRGVCEDCGISSVARADFIHPKFSSMTCSFAETAGRLMEELTCEATGRILGVPSKTMWELDQYRMEVMLQFMSLPKDVDVSYLCADEVHFRTVPNKVRHGLFAKRWRPEFVTNLVAPNEGKVLFNAIGRDSEALMDAISVLSPGQRLAVEAFAVDIHKPFLSVGRRVFPNAKICIDRFHLAKIVNEAFDLVRKAEFKRARKSNELSTSQMLEPHRRFILVSRQKDLSKAEQKLLDKFREENSTIHVAMLMVETFHKALDKKTLKGFRSMLQIWYQLVRESKLRQFRRVAKLIRHYRDEIEAYITSRLTTAVAEGLNNKIKVLRRMGYGYTNPVSYCRKILQRCGYLNHLSINTEEFFYRWPDPAIHRR
jgi:transposase